MLRILYLATGPSESLHAQAYYAMLSALAWGDGSERIHLHADSPRYYAPLAALAPERVAIETVRLGGSTEHVFELKLSVIRQSAERFAGEAILFCDADTFFMRSYSDLAAKLCDGQRALHRREYDVATHATPQMRKFRRALGNAGLLAGGGPTAMWNSGVVGLPPGRVAVPDAALATFAKLSPHTKKQYLAEQFSMSHAMASRGTITAAEDWIFHYWYQKAEYTRAIEQLLTQWKGKPLDEVTTELRRHCIALPASPPKLHGWEKVLIAAGLRTRPPEIRGLPQKKASEI